MSAVSALPDCIALFSEDKLLLDVVKQFFVAELMLLFDGGNLLKKICDLVETFCAGVCGKRRIHLGPLVTLAVCCILKIGHSIGYGSVMKQLEPYFRMFLLIERGCCKKFSYLDIAVLDSF